MTERMHFVARSRLRSLYIPNLLDRPKPALRHLEILTARVDHASSFLSPLTIRSRVAEVASKEQTKGRKGLGFGWLSGGTRKHG